MLSTTSQHALRALTHMASLPEGTAILGRQLSERAGIPANYLSKILLTLGNAGILDATRGTGGGYRLRKKPEQIRLIEVVDLFDRARARPECFLGGGRICSDTSPCTAHGEFRDVRATYLRFLESTSIADISLMERPRGRKR
ncbi:MAG: Rrf2 family transcriptional regulator [Acidobacteria bacterium]|nr:Rrf2 family transcriptional regulator [Acidobacteriota bacterium]MBI3469982.1 Rrf2 family transcriptional regulator [Candidatus Solibacter usitatus]